jgi:hypothetical protein
MAERTDKAPALPNSAKALDTTPVHQYLANLDTLAALPQCCLHCLARADDRHTTDATSEVHTNVVVTCTHAACNSHKPLRARKASLFKVRIM